MAARISVPIPQIYAPGFVRFWASTQSELDLDG